MVSLSTLAIGKDLRRVHGDERGPRAQFDIVAGVSTGGLLANFAFLGADPLKFNCTEMNRPFTLGCEAGRFAEA